MKVFFIRCKDEYQNLWVDSAYTNKRIAQNEIRLLNSQYLSRKYDIEERDIWEITNEEDTLVYTIITQDGDDDVWIVGVYREIEDCVEYFYSLTEHGWTEKCNINSVQICI